MWIDRIVLLSLRERLPPTSMQHFPPTWLVGAGKVKAKNNEHRTWDVGGINAIHYPVKERYTPGLWEDMVERTSKAMSNGTLLFAINYTLLEDNAYIPTLQFTITYSTAVNNKSCIATLVNEICDIKVAIVQYPIIVEKQTVTLNSNKYSNEGLLVTYPGDMPNVSQYDTAGPLGGLTWTIEQFLWSYGALFQFFDNNTNTTIYELVEDGITSDLYRQMESNMNACVAIWNRPTEAVLESFRQLIFRAGLYVAGTNDTQNMPVVQTTPLLVYKSEYSYLSIAVVIIVITSCTCIIPL